jgi:thiol-disulfide isomerase/thioredoxin
LQEGYVYPPGLLNYLTPFKKQIMKKWLLVFAAAAMVGCAGNGNSAADSEAAQESDSLASVEANVASELPEGVMVKSIDKAIAGEEVFKAIVADYKGKPVLVDFWATWCPPCRAAMKTIVPVKEAMADKVTFVYVTTTSSPEDTWNEMIKEIHGVHYYVTEDQWNTLLDQFESEGIPTYVIVDKEGNVVNKYVGFPGVEIVSEELGKLL